ncbi:MAG: hypothetical protein Q7S31_03505 [bacterium]|nr:hypothetical protein [bacterium]
MRWWEEYLNNPLKREVVETIAKKYWEMYSSLIHKADKQWVRTCGKQYIAKKMVKADAEWLAAQRVAQPLLEEWAEICQRLARTIQ